MSLSIVIITHNRLELLKRCLDSVEREFEQKTEVIVILNGEDSESFDYLKSKSGIHFSQIERTSPANARNIALTRVADSQWVGFLDDDIQLPSGYGLTLAKLISTYDCKVIGGPDATAPEASDWEQALGLALTSPLSTSKTRYRHDRTLKMIQATDESALILCNLWIHTSALSTNPFPVDYWRNEENIMLQGLALNNIKMLWSPELYVFHKRKDSLSALYRAVSSSGQHRLKSFLDLPHTLDWKFFAPAIFVFYLILLPLLLCQHTAWCLPALAYLLLNLTTSLIYGAKSWAKVAVIQLIINLSYGIGMWRGLIRGPDQE
tara:strand:+ start:18207 stop:19166 length:960 start_codon:yes stop_codon:yes gene_type:complete